MTGQPRQLHAVTPGDGRELGRHMERVRRLLEAHGGEVEIIPPPLSGIRTGRWLAIVPMGSIPGNPDGTTLGSDDPDELMDQLEAIYPHKHEKGAP